MLASPLQCREIRRTGRARDSIGWAASWPSASSTARVSTPSVRLGNLRGEDLPERVQQNRENPAFIARLFQCQQSLPVYLGRFHAGAHLLAMQREAVCEPGEADVEFTRDRQKRTIDTVRARWSGCSASELRMALSNRAEVAPAARLAKIAGVIVAAIASCCNALRLSVRSMLNLFPAGSQPTSCASPAGCVGKPAAYCGCIIRMQLGQSSGGRSSRLAFVLNSTPTSLADCTCPS